MAYLAAVVVVAAVAIVDATVVEQVAVDVVLVVEGLLSRTRPVGQHWSVVPELPLHCCGSWRPCGLDGFVSTSFPGDRWGLPVEH